MARLWLEARYLAFDDETFFEGRPETRAAYDPEGFWKRFELPFLEMSRSYETPLCAWFSRTYARELTPGAPANTPALRIELVDPAEAAAQRGKKRARR